MLLREAMQLIAPARLSEARRAALVCSFEPLHLETYLQAHLARRWPEETPRVIRWGYDQLREALAQTASHWRTSPALLCLAWDDLHPALSWRSRAPLVVTPEAVTEQAQSLRTQLVDWLQRRAGADTVVALPPLAWLPLHDATPPGALGPVALAASSAMQALAAELAALGAKVLRDGPRRLNFRELVQSGCPMAVEDSDGVAQAFVDVALAGSGRKKAVVVDLDGTLWDGVIGEDGPEGIRCGPDGAGAPHRVFQKFLSKLRAEGVWLAFCSKNNPDDVLPVFGRLDLPLRLADFSAYRCDWQPKAKSLASIAAELNIQLEDLVLIDDNPAEIAAVQAACPGLVVLHTPRDAAGWQVLVARLQELFGTWRVSEEDRLRLRRAPPTSPSASTFSAAEAQAGWSHLRPLALEVAINRQAGNDPRSLELINKTNQFQLNGERLSAEAWLEWLRAPEAWCCSARLCDRVGDFGTIAVVTGCRRPDGELWVRQFALSCRAFGRGVETLLLADLAHLGGWETVCGPFVPTGKNEPLRQFLAQLGCPMIGAGEWHVARGVIEALAERITSEAGVGVTAATPPIPRPATAAAGSTPRSSGASAEGGVAGRGTMARVST